MLFSMVRARPARKDRSRRQVFPLETKRFYAPTVSSNTPLRSRPQLKFEFSLWTREMVAELFFLPPYSPDRNPDELVWKHLKADTVGRMAVTSKEDFAKKVRHSMRNLQNDARKIISFFQKPSLKYAA